MSAFAKPFKPLVVMAELTANSPGANDSGHRYRVGYCHTLEEAETLIAKDVAEMSQRVGLGGLVDWGKAAPREYAVFAQTYERVK